MHQLLRACYVPILWWTADVFFCVGSYRKNNFSGRYLENHSQPSLSLHRVLIQVCIMVILGWEIIHKPRIILCMCPANERWWYSITPYLIGWVHTYNDSCIRYCRSFISVTCFSSYYIRVLLVRSVTEFLSCSRRSVTEVLSCSCIILMLGVEKIMNQKPSRL